LTWEGLLRLPAEVSNPRLLPPAKAAYTPGIVVRRRRSAGPDFSMSRLWLTIRGVVLATYLEGSVD
jgi:hypothetical protein